MLADPRRKQKLSADPRNLAWKNDQNKIATKLMEKMGWTEGKGLGANCSGKLEPIKVQVKGDNRGVGCTRNYADNWIAHQDDFNSLLANLNSSGSTESSGYGSDPEPRGVQKLEEKGRSSKGRVHYMKFAKGKDLSAKSSEDMDCIFGKRKSISAPVTPQTQSEANSEDEDAGVEEKKAEFESGIQTFTSGTSVQDYFAKKMAALKSGGSSQAPLQPAEVADPEPRSGFGFGFVAASVDTKDVPEEQTSDKPKKKRKKNKKRKEEEEKLKEDSDSSPSPIEDLEEPRKKKKKEKKRKHKEEESNEDNSDIQQPPVEEETEERSPKKKKSKKRRKEEAETEADINERTSEKQKSGTPASPPEDDETQEQPEKKKKKSKKLREEEDGVTKNQDEDSSASADNEKLTEKAKKSTLEKQTTSRTCDVNENLDLNSVLNWKKGNDMGFKGSSFVDIKGYGHGFDTSLTVMPMSETRRKKIKEGKRKK